MANPIFRDRVLKMIVNLVTYEREYGNRKGVAITPEKIADEIIEDVLSDLDMQA